MDLYTVTTQYARNTLHYTQCYTLFGNALSVYTQLRSLLVFGCSLFVHIAVDGAMTHPKKILFVCWWSKWREKKTKQQQQQVHVNNNTIWEMFKLIIHRFYLTRSFTNYCLKFADKSWSGAECKRFFALGFCWGTGYLYERQRDFCVWSGGGKSVQNELPSHISRQQMRYQTEIYYIHFRHLYIPETLFFFFLF